MPGSPNQAHPRLYLQLPLIFCLTFRHMVDCNPGKCFNSFSCLKSRIFISFLSFVNLMELTSNLRWETMYCRTDRRISGLRQIYKPNTWSIHLRLKRYSFLFINFWAFLPPCMFSKYIINTASTIVDWILGLLCGLMWEQTWCVKFSNVWIAEWSAMVNFCVLSVILFCCCFLYLWSCEAIVEGLGCFPLFFNTCLLLLLFFWHCAPSVGSMRTRSVFFIIQRIVFEAFKSQINVIREVSAH